MTTTAEYKAEEAKYYMQVVRRMPPVLVRGEGTRVFDNDGKSYLDFTAGWAVLNLGHSHPRVTEAIREQAGLILQMSNLFYTLPQLDLARTIVETSSLDRVFFCNSGAEANEGASKLARKYGKLNLGGAYEIITAFNSRVRERRLQRRGRNKERDERQHLRRATRTGPGRGRCECPRRRVLEVRTGLVP